MKTLSLLRDWRHCVRNQLLPGLHGHQAKALADFSLAMAWTRQCQSGWLAVSVPGPARPASVRRRLERLVANPRLRPRLVLARLARQWLTAWTGRPLLLILDETPNGADLRCLKLSAGYRKRAVPLLGVCYRTDRPPEPMPRLITHMLRRAARCVPPGTEVTLLLDRGLAWPDVLDTCAELGWHFVTRVQGTTRLRRLSGTWCAVRDLVPRPGARWYGRGQVFKKAGGRTVSVIAVWERGCVEPWLLVSDRPASYPRCRGYAKRMWIEELFRDEKRQGFQWQRSRLTDPTRALRLLLIMALATLLTLSLGTRVLKAGLRRWFEPRRQRMLSLTQLGLRWFHYVLIHDWPLVLQCQLHPQ